MSMRCRRAGVSKKKCEIAFPFIISVTFNISRYKIPLEPRPPKEILAARRDGSESRARTIMYNFQ
eukprot:scaffold51766_cov53-Attheya_sp.AAC.3